MGYSFCNGCGVKAPAAGDTHQSISITCPSGHAMVAYVTQKQGSCDACGARVLHGHRVVGGPVDEEAASLALGRHGREPRDNRLGGEAHVEAAARVAILVVESGCLGCRSRI